MRKIIISLLVMIILASCSPSPTLVIPVATGTEAPKPTASTIPTFTTTPTIVTLTPTATVTPVPPTQISPLSAHAIPGLFRGNCIRGQFQQTAGVWRVWHSRKVGRQHLFHIFLYPGSGPAHVGPWQAGDQHRQGYFSPA